ncbi:hypothetical protein ACJX0J_012963, partial [Zea mays]
FTSMLALVDKFLTTAKGKYSNNSKKIIVLNGDFLNLFFVQEQSFLKILDLIVYPTCLGAQIQAATKTLLTLNLTKFVWLNLHKYFSSYVIYKFSAEFKLNFLNELGNVHLSQCHLLIWVRLGTLANIFKNLCVTFF